MDLKKMALLALPSLFSEKKLHCWSLTMFHGLVIRCDRCGAPLEGKARKSFLKHRITTCANCKQKVQRYRGTVFHAAKISMGQLVLLAALLELKVPVRQICSTLGMADASVRDWARKLEAQQGTADE